MTPRRAVVLLLTFVLAVLLALGAWGTTSPPARDDDHYIAIAISQPEVFHPTPGGGARVSAHVVERTPSYVAVDVTSDNDHFRVLIDPQTDQVTRVIKE